MINFVFMAKSIILARLLPTSFPGERTWEQGCSAASIRLTDSGSMSSGLTDDGRKAK